jgi:hypothetical protein
LLGKLLMELRQQLTEEDKDKKQRDEVYELFRQSQIKVYKWRAMLGQWNTIEGAYEKWQNTLMYHYKLTKIHGHSWTSVNFIDLDKYCFV